MATARGCQCNMHAQTSRALPCLPGARTPGSGRQGPGTAYQTTSILESPHTCNVPCRGCRLPHSCLHSAGLPAQLPDKVRSSPQHCVAADWQQRFADLVCTAAGLVAASANASCASVLRIPKVALMFLTQEAMPHERLWEKWLASVAGLVPTLCTANAVCARGGFKVSHPAAPPSCSFAQTCVYPACQIVQMKEAVAAVADGLARQ